MYTPEYLKAIQDNVNSILRDADEAMNVIERSTPYNDRLHPFHASAVSTYNQLFSIVITARKYQTEPDGETIPLF